MKVITVSLALLIFSSPIISAQTTKDSSPEHLTNFPTETERIEMEKQFQLLIQQQQEEETLPPFEEAIRKAAALPTIVSQLLQDKHGDVYGIIGVQIDQQNYAVEIQYGLLTSLYGRVWRSDIDKPLFWDPAMDVDPDVLRSPITRERRETPENQARDVAASKKVTAILKILNGTNAQNVKVIGFRAADSNLPVINSSFATIPVFVRGDPVGIGMQTVRETYIAVEQEKQNWTATLRAEHVDPILGESSGSMYMIFHRLDVKKQVDVSATAAVARPEEASLAKGISLSETHKYEEALNAFNRALAINPECLSAWVDRGTTFALLGKDQEAVAACDKALELDPNNAEVLGNKGAFLDSLGRYDEALIADECSLLVNPKNPFVLRNKGFTLAGLEKLDEALAAIDESLELEPNNTRALLKKGVILGQLDRNEEASTIFEKVIQIDPRNAGGWADKGISLSKMGKDEEAVAAFDRALDIEPNNAIIWRNKAVILNGLGRRAEAEECFKRYDQLK
jgi:tetratricopeptide (TPR) repeat protein